MSFVTRMASSRAMAKCLKMNKTTGRTALSTFNLTRCPSVSLASRLTLASNRRGYALASKDNNREFVQLRLQEIFEKILANPGVLRACQSLTETLDAKGLAVKNGQQPSLIQMVKVMADKEVQQKVHQIREEMQQANISITKEEIAPLISLFKGKL